VCVYVVGGGERGEQPKIRGTVCGTAKAGTTGGGVPQRVRVEECFVALQEGYCRCAGQGVVVVGGGARGVERHMCAGAIDQGGEQGQRADPHSA
jgi:hypothetical protein